MAKVVDKYIGSLSGALGDMVFRRYKNGSVFVARRKSSDTISYSPNCVQNRSKFKTVVKFAKVANTLPDIYKIWKNPAYAGRSPYTKILKQNIGSINDKFLPTHSCKLTPDGFGFFYELISVNSENISINLKLGKQNSNLINKKFTFNCVLALHNPKPLNNGESEVVDFICVTASAEIIFENYTEYKTLNLHINTFSQKIVLEYQNAIAIGALTNVEETPFIFSESIFAESEIS